MHLATGGHVHAPALEADCLSQTGAHETKYNTDHSNISIDRESLQNRGNAAESLRSLKPANFITPCRPNAKCAKSSVRFLPLKFTREPDKDIIWAKSTGVKIAQ
jgi:hypothetical protein